MGAGDGRFALAHALAHPDELVIAIDASRDAMVESSRRAARSSQCGGAPNLLCLVAAAEALPEPLAGIVDLLAIHFPWGSLLRGATGAASELTARLAGLVAPTGQVRMLLASAPRDTRAGEPDLDPGQVVAAWASFGLRPTLLRPATLADAVEAHSSWGKRLLRNADPGRLAWCIGLKRTGAGQRRAD